MKIRLFILILLEHLTEQNLGLPVNVSHTGHLINIRLINGNGPLLLAQFLEQNFPGFSCCILHFGHSFIRRIIHINSIQKNDKYIGPDERLLSVNFT